MSKLARECVAILKTNGMLTNHAENNHAEMLIDEKLKSVREILELHLIVFGNEDFLTKQQLLDLSRVVEDTNNVF